jgi:hypothetical protein
MIVMVSPMVQSHGMDPMSKDGFLFVGGARRHVFLGGLGAAVAAGRPLTASATSRKQNFPGSGTPHGIAAMRQDQVIADLLAFISNHDHASSAIPWMSQ